MAKEAFTGRYIAANGTFDISEFACVLKRIIIDTKGATSNLLTVKSYGSAPDTYAVVDTTIAPIVLDFDMFCPKGLTILLATGTAAKITVIYG